MKQQKKDPRGKKSCARGGVGKKTSLKCIKQNTNLFLFSLTFFFWLVSCVNVRNNFLFRT